ncbi:hypothetical protein BD626DRAFT_517586 [Schizophyllum amplum]|uniref:Uncharacterized protein n=1 Tax=Schizophyllum amplum TaxID=97359 RepID=A0A550BWD5_9AGAR|nr:hypothetical protein BD626DRAFT_517586 [Auriculariopsis ampla]
MVDLSESKRHYNKDIRPASLFPDLQIAYFIYGSNHWLFSYCLRLSDHRNLEADARLRNALIQPFKNLLDSLEPYFLRMADTWSAFVEVCDAYRAALPPLLDVDTLETHVKRIQQGYEAHHALSGQCAHHQSFRAVSRLGLLPERYRGGLFAERHIAIQPFDCDSEFMSMKSAVSDAIKSLPVTLAQMRTLEVMDRTRVSDDIGFTRFMVSIWVDKDEQRANMIKAYNQELHEGNRY